MKESEEKFISKEEAKQEKESIPSMKILLVEDKIEYQKTAKKTLESIDPEMKIRLETAKDYKEAKELFEKAEKEPKGKFDCVITDLFFPEGSKKEKMGPRLIRRLIEVLERNKDYYHYAENGIQLLRHAEEFPLGLEIVLEARREGIPYVIATAGEEGHGTLSEVVFFAAQFAKIQSRFTSPRDLGRNPKPCDWIDYHSWDVITPQNIDWRNPHRAGKETQLFWKGALKKAISLFSEKK